MGRKKEFKELQAEVYKLQDRIWNLEREVQIQISQGKFVTETTAAYIPMSKSLKDIVLLLLDHFNLGYQEQTMKGFFRKEKGGKQ